MPRTKTYAILGAGNSGMAMAAHLALNGYKVHLWNRSFENIKAIIETNQIHAQGMIEGTANLSLVSTWMSKVVKQCKTLFVATPASAHHEVARQLAPLVNSSMTIILNPGRTFGAIDFINTLRRYGCKSMPVIAESQTIIYTCRREETNHVSVLALKHHVLLAAAHPEESRAVFDNLPECLKEHFQVSQSMIHTSLGNVGMILHCAPVLMNTGWIENNKTQFKYYYDGITSSIAAFLELLDRERLTLAQHLGVEIESVTQWMRRVYEIPGESLYECIQNNEAYQKIDAPGSLNHRYITEDIPCGLVPLECLGYLLDVRTPLTTTIIDLANALTKSNFRQIGRVIEHDDIELLKSSMKPTEV